VSCVDDVKKKNRKTRIGGSEFYFKLKDWITVVVWDNTRAKHLRRGIILFGLLCIVGSKISILVTRLRLHIWQGIKCCVKLRVFRLIILLAWWLPENYNYLRINLLPSQRSKLRSWDYINIVYCRGCFTNTLDACVCSRFLAALLLFQLIS